jgi:hypothetical protein
VNLQAYYILHYGKEWLEWSLKSVRPFVDRVHIFYTPHPSHGTQTKSRKCPDSRTDLYEIAAPFDVVWHDVDQFYQEGQHRDHAVQVCTDDGADLVMVVDGDEVWDPDDLSETVGMIAGRPERSFGVRVQGHFWRGVNWVCRDACMPIRFINPHGEGTTYDFAGPGFYHFGYAQSKNLVAYKMSIHGHRSEIRPNWFVYRFSRWEPGITDVHPTNVNFWNPEAYDRNLIAHLIGDHPYFNDEMV